MEHSSEAGPLPDPTTSLDASGAGAPVIEQFSNDVIVRKLDALATRLGRLEDAMAEHHHISANLLARIAIMAGMDPRSPESAYIAEGVPQEAVRIEEPQEAPPYPETPQAYNPPYPEPEEVAEEAAEPALESTESPVPGTATRRRREFEAQQDAPLPAEDSNQTRIELPAIHVIPDIKFPDPGEKDWNAWVEAWVQAEHRASVLGEQVPQVSMLLFSPGGGQDILDTWKSLCTGRDAVLEATSPDRGDPQIKHLAALTLARYEQEMEPLRKQSAWHSAYRRLREAIAALAASAHGDTKLVVTQCEIDLAVWSNFMDRENGWFVSGQGYMESVAFSLATMYDKLADRPGSQAQFQIETKADMTVYQVIRAIETFLGQMNVVRDKELSIGRPIDQLTKPRLGEVHPMKKTPIPGASKPSAPSQRVSRIFRNRWLLMSATGRELSELIKPSFEVV